jgi:phosphoglucosamine mutase
MNRRYFGTDGIRGTVGKLPMMPDFVLHLGYAAGKVLAARAGGGGRPTVLIGKDTRVSGYMLEAALEAGFSAAGVDVLLCGPLPTPGIAYLTRALRLTAGVVISASHNLYQDNGIKFFSGDGFKLPDSVECEIEIALQSSLMCNEASALGRARRVSDASGRYVEFCKSTFPADLNLKGLKIVVDCAHGAAYQVAPSVFHELGADVSIIGASPDGLNINAGFGATAPKALTEEVQTKGADLGVALDGDGDRVVIVDRRGRVYEGDQILLGIVRYRASLEQVSGVVGTVMTNLAIEHAFLELGIQFVRAGVGDRYVVEMMQEQGWKFGGENSGHIVCLDKHTTGDGIVSALQILDAILRTGRDLPEIVGDVTMYPQVLLNLPLREGFDWGGNEHISMARSEAEKLLSGTGRLLLRASGTEPVLRVMTEGSERQLVERAAEMVAGAVQLAMSE